MERVVYTLAEIYRLYGMLRADKWRRLCRFFFGFSKEPASVRDAFAAIDRRQHGLWVKNVERPEDLDEEFSRVTLPGILWIMYEEPYDRMPLYINKKGYSVVARWRMQLGK